MTVRSCSPTTIRAAILAVLLPLGALSAQQPPAKTAPAKAAPAPAAAAQSATLIKVIGVDYSFTSPEFAPAGVVTFNLVNQGADLHALALFELPTNHSLKDFLDQYHAQGMIPAWMIGLGQTPTIAPQAEAFITARLKAGRYILACLIPARDGRMHTEKGMVKMITVR
jgi:uncharacterized cupredoxin-like copper-binding protein